MADDLKQYARFQLFGCLYFLIAIASGIAGFFTTFFLACWIEPTHTPEGHVVMPLGQTILGSAAGVLSFLAVLFFSGRNIFRKK